jgi:predicted ester cyclase
MSRWTLQGTHDGHGIYGDPSGARIRIMGISHHHIKNEKISEEWMLFDEFAMLKQIYRAKLGIGK